MKWIIIIAVISLIGGGFLGYAISSFLTNESETEGLQNQITGLQVSVSNLQNTVSSKENQIISLEAELSRILGIHVTQHYTWNYLYSSWYWDLPIYLSDYIDYRDKPRGSSISSYVNMATDPGDDTYINDMIQGLNDLALEQHLNEAQKLNFVITFVQSMPYTVDNVTTLADEYPRYPIETLFDRGGDCEDTSILVAALLEAMGYDVALLHLENAQHMAVGVSIPGTYGQYYEYGGKQYFYLETTGEGWQIGIVPPSITDIYAYVYPLSN